MTTTKGDPMSDLTIITNHVPRFILEAHELEPSERAEFDYVDWDAVERGEASASFVRYRGQLVDLGEFMAAPADFVGWQGYSSDSFFSGLVVRFSEDGESVVMGRYYS